MKQTKKRIKNIIVLNGPPGVGKDTLASILVEHYSNAKSMSFKSHLTPEIFSRYPINEEEWYANYDDRE